MLSETKNLCKRLFEWLKTNEKPARRGGGEFYLAIVVVLVAAISFGLGRLSKIREEKTPITVENAETSTGTIADASNKNVTEKILEQNLGNVSQPQKIFVASRNGKKYYYAWCDAVKTIKGANRVWFPTEEEAKTSGYEPAANCKGLK